jgi:hypothetical protein
MSAANGPVPRCFKACPADGVRTEFGVCRGDPIQHIQDLILGDTFLPKRDARWHFVTPTHSDTESFTLSTAANSAPLQLITLAELIFMSTHGQRLDVYAAVGLGKLYFVSETEFRAGVEYVLIDIQPIEDAVVPAIIPTDTPATAQAGYGRPSKPVAPTLRLIG